jgi:hypothetical protein
MVGYVTNVVILGFLKYLIFYVLQLIVLSVDHLVGIGRRKNNGS